MCTELAPRRECAQAGFTLVELIVFIVIVSVAVVGVLTVMNVTVKASADPLLRKQTIAMSEAVLEEVLAKDYGSPSSTTPSQSVNCTDRSTYATVDDYNCFAGATAGARILGSQMLSTTSGPLPDTYWAKVVVALTTLNGIDMKMVTVTANDPGGAAYSLTAYRACYQEGC